MKKTLSIIIALALAAGLSACYGSETGGTTSPSPSAVPSSQAPADTGAPPTADAPPTNTAPIYTDAERAAMAAQIREYFPDNENTLCVFESPTLALINQEIYTLYTDSQRVQRVISSQNFLMTEVMEIADGELRLIYGTSGNICTENLLDKELDPYLPQVILKAPFEQGQKWAPFDGAESVITSMSTPVSTLSGSYDAMEVTTNYYGGVYGSINELKTYYAKGVGKIKEMYTNAENSDVSVELSSFKKDTGVDLPMPLYALSETGETLVADNTVHAVTNIDFISILNESMRGTLINEDASMLSISVDRVFMTATADFSKGFVIGGPDREAILEHIAYTLGEFYTAKTVSFTENGVKTGALDAYSGVFVSEEEAAQAEPTF